MNNAMLAMAGHIPAAMVRNENIFEKFDRLAAQATTSIQVCVLVSGAAIVAITLVRTKGSIPGLVTSGIVAALAIWLVASGINMLAGTAGDTLDEGVTGSQVWQIPDTWDGVGGSGDLR